MPIRVHARGACISGAFLSDKGRRIAILGDMLNLVVMRAMHAELARDVAANHIDLVFAAVP